jgi:uncharacterized membrane protein YfcA
VTRSLFRSWIPLTLLGLGAGLLNGLLGAAGGVLLVVLLPYLDPPPRLLPHGQTAASPPKRQDVLATAMAVMLPISAVSGAIYWLGGVRPAPALLLSMILPSALGGLLGAKLLGRLPDRALRILFALLITVSGLRMLL